MEPLDSYELQRLWNDARVAEKRAGGNFVEIIAHSVDARNPNYAGGQSKIIRLQTRNGQHIGTIHEIQMPDGTVPHNHPKDYTDRDCQRFRSVNEPIE